MSLLLKQKMWHVRPTAEAYFETSTLRLKDFDTILDFKAWNSRTLFAAFSHHGILLLQGFIFKNNWPWSLMSLLLLPPFLRDAGPADFLPSFCSRFISNMALHYWFFRILLLFWMPHLTFCTQVIRGFWHHKESPRSHLCLGLGDRESALVRCFRAMKKPVIQRPPAIWMGY